MGDVPLDIAAPFRARLLSSGQIWSLWQPWINRGALATIDQGLVSGSNFVLTVILARWLSAADYGGYGLVLAVVALITTIHQALLLEPMSILGPARYFDCPREYMAVLIRLNTILSVMASVFLAGLALCARLMHAPGELPVTLGALAMSFPVTLLFWLVRGGCYLELEPAPAAMASLAYSVLALGGACALHLLGWISAASVLLWMGAASGLGATILLFRLRRLSKKKGVAPLLGEIWREHWRYGRWALAAAPVMWIPENICYGFASMSLGIAQVGVFRAMMNVVTPALQLANSSSRLVNPYLSGKAGKHGCKNTRMGVFRIVLLFAVIGVLYASALLLFHRPVFHILYGGRFGDAEDLLGWMGLVTISYLLIYGPMSGLRVIQAPFLVFVAYCGAAISGVITGLPLTSKYGLRGTAVSLCIANVCASGLAAWFFHNRTGRAPSRSDETREVACREP